MPIPRYPRDPEPPDSPHDVDACPDCDQYVCECGRPVDDQEEGE